MKAIEVFGDRSQKIYGLLCATGCEESGRCPAGRAIGCAEAPQAGLHPYGLPSLTRSGPSPRTSQLPSLSEPRV